jgi:ATP/maltotriose-dependent transcriptional regulator MalT
LTAAEQFAAALEMMEQGDATSVDRGWLLTRYARTIRGVDSQRALAIIDTAKTLAEQADDAPLLAYNLYSRGQIRGLVGDVAGAITDLRLSVEILGRLSHADRERLARYEHDGYIASSVEIEGYLTGLLAIAGYIEEAHARATALIERSHNMTMHGWFTLATTHALTGRPHASLDAFMACRHSLRGINDDSPLVTIALNQLWMYHRPYAADQLEERRQIAQDAERNLERTGGSFGEISPRLASLPWLFLEGDWDATREIALKVTEEANVSSIQHLISAVILARLALAQGDVALAWQMVRRPLPAGSHTPPGHADLEPSLALMRVAVELCLDGGDLIAAQAWLTAHDRWLEWSGATLGLAESRLLWARIAQATNDLPGALEHAQRALEIAEAPRQPLVQAASYRTLGQLATLAGRVDEARQHLDRALERADACAAIYERALTLLAIAELERRIGESGALESALSEARTIFTRLGAIPALARVEALAVQSAGDAGATTAAAFGLSPRELEVLRLIAIGGRNREIADQLFLSVRTVERHITNLYAKLGIRSRSEAIAFAHTHDIR